INLSQKLIAHSSSPLSSLKHHTSVSSPVLNHHTPVPLQIHQNPHDELATINSSTMSKCSLISMVPSNGNNNSSNNQDKYTRRYSMNCNNSNSHNNIHNGMSSISHSEQRLQSNQPVHNRFNSLSAISNHKSRLPRFNYEGSSNALLTKYNNQSDHEPILSTVSTNQKLKLIQGSTDVQNSMFQSKISDSLNNLNSKLLKNGHHHQKQQLGEGNPHTQQSGHSSNQNGSKFTEGNHHHHEISSTSNLQNGNVTHQWNNSDVSKIADRVVSFAYFCLFIYVMESLAFVLSLLDGRRRSVRRFRHFSFLLAPKTSKEVIHP
ncbi:unnamed protein product, partial [Trichobilharzia regenti]